MYQIDKQQFFFVFMSMNLNVLNRDCAFSHLKKGKKRLLAEGDYHFIFLKLITM